MKSSEYWQRRMMAVEQLSYEKSLAYWDDLERQYKAVSESIQSDIARWYQRFAENNQISMADAKRLLNTRKLKEFRWTVEDYIKYGRDNLDGKWAKQLENASARVHVSRLEALQIQLQQHIEELYGNQLDGLDKLLRDVYTTEYDHTMFEVQRGFSIGWSFQRFNEDQLDAVLKMPWTTDNQTFRDRCLTQKEALVSNLQKSLIQAFIRGDALDKVSRALAKEMNVALNKASRLVQTEASYFANNAQKRCYKDLDVERVEVVETLDSRTCDTCGSMDGKVIKLSDAEPGITIPPYHPNCRGCTAPYFEDDVGERVARNDEGETYYVPSDMTFEQWKKQQDEMQRAKKERIERDATPIYEAMREKGLLRMPELDKFADMQYNNSPAYQKLLERYQNLTGEREWSAVEFNPETLADHASRHGCDFGVTNANEYAKAALEFINHVTDKSVITDAEGVRRMYSETNNIFSSAYPDGTIRTFFKPRQGKKYWEGQMKKFGKN